MKDEDFKTTENMMKYGGSFVKKLGELARLADDDNLIKIKSAWKEYWNRYASL